jgi:hypothetical protein
MNTPVGIGTAGTYVGRTASGGIYCRHMRRSAVALSARCHEAVVGARGVRRT